MDKNQNEKNITQEFKEKLDVAFNHLPEDEKMIGLLMLGLTTYIKLSESDMLTLGVLLQLLVKKDRDTTLTFVAGLNHAIANTIKQEKKGKNNEQEN